MPCTNLEHYPATGRWAVMIFAQCRADQTTVVFWAEQDRVRSQLADIANRLTEPFAVNLDRLAGDGDPRERLCRGIDRVLRDGLDGDW